jgi:glycine betaine/proline transport system ATP-binding protein
MRLGVASVGNHVAAGTTIEEAISLLTHNAAIEQLTVVGAENQPLGTVNLRQLACALITSEERCESVRMPVEDSVRSEAPVAVSRA